MRRLALLIFPGFQILDVTGPLAAFEIADQYAGGGAYEVRLLAEKAGPVRSSCGVSLLAEPLDEQSYDTLMASGGDGTRDREALRGAADWLRRRAPSARRVTSVCSGAFVLAEAGLLDGRRCTTHWGRTDQFARLFPLARLEPDRIYVRDGPVWTSAGITAGIDLALALIEEDLGDQIARGVARQLVVHHRRAGGQSQFSELIDMGGPSGRFGPLLDWARERLGERLSVEQLAAQAGMSPRNFARAFAAETGGTPAKAVERLRLEAARARVEATREPIDRVAEAVGFGDPERMRRAFVRAFGQPPQAFRRSARA
jgi:transcriptional regulator GlxA family with amidase domain